MWQSGMMAPIKIAKTVMASAQRVTGRRQVALAETQNRGDQRAGVADADPENEIGDIEGPEDRGVDAPDADAGIELITKCSHAREQQAGRERHGDPILRRCCGRSAAADPARFVQPFFASCQVPRSR